MTNTKVKCAGCGKEITKEEWHMKGGKKYCTKCFQNFEGYQDLVDYITQSPFLYAGDSRNVAYIRSQVTKLQKENPTCTFKEMLNTLKYLYEYEGHNITLPPFDPEIGFTWIIKKYFARAQDAIEKEIIRQKEFYSKYTPEVIDEIVNNTPDIIIEVSPQVYQEELEDSQERLKNYLYGPEIDLENMDFGEV